MMGIIGIVRKPVSYKTVRIIYMEYIIEPKRLNRTGLNALNTVKAVLFSFIAGHFITNLLLYDYF